MANTDTSGKNAVFTFLHGQSAMLALPSLDFATGTLLCACIVAIALAFPIAFGDNPAPYPRL